MRKHPDLDLKMTQMIDCMEAARVQFMLAYTHWLYVSSYTFTADIPVPEFGDKIEHALRITDSVQHDMLETDFGEE